MGGTKLKPNQREGRNKLTGQAWHMKHLPRDICPNQKWFPCPKSKIKPQKSIVSYWLGLWGQSLGERAKAATWTWHQTSITD